MTSATTTGEVMRIVLPAELKARFLDKCNAYGQKMSERARQLIVADLAEEETPADKLSAILKSAQTKNARSGLPVPTIEAIDEFIDNVRQERIDQGLVQ